MRLGGFSYFCGASKSGISLPSTCNQSMKASLSRNVKKKFGSPDLPNTGSHSSRAKQSRWHDIVQMLLDPQIGSANARHRNIQNVIGDKIDLFRRSTFQSVIDVDAPDNRVWTTSVTNQNYTVHLRLVSKATTLEDRLNWSYLPLELNDSRCLHLSPDKYSSGRKLRYGHCYLRIP